MTVHSNADGPLSAIERLTAANRAEPDGETEARLVQLRHEAFAELGAAEPSSTSADPGAFESPRELDAATLSARQVRDAIESHGFASVRELIPPKTVDRLVVGIDRALDGHDAFMADRSTSPWFTPFRPSREWADKTLPATRRQARVAGSVWTADSPRVLFQLLEAFAAEGLDRLVVDYLGERPALSAKKSTLRRVPLDTQYAAWHQDGAFLGTSGRVLNVWLCLSHCGRDAPSLEIVPRRIDHVVETGTEGAIFPWTVAPAMVDRVAAQTPIERPVFAPGDVLLFDELFLHRTACDDTMTRERHAIETWCFAPSTYPSGQIPLVW